MEPNVKLIAAGATATGAGMLDSLSINLFNVPLNVIILAGAGALLSHAYGGSGDPLPRKKFYFSLLANTFTACAAVSVLPASMGWGWYDVKMEGSMAFLFALSARFAVPFVFKLLPEIAKRWFRIGEYKDIQKDSQDGTK